MLPEIKNCVAYPKQMVFPFKIAGCQFIVMDIVAALTCQKEYTNTRN